MLLLLVGRGIVLLLGRIVSLIVVAFSRSGRVVVGFSFLLLVSIVVASSVVVVCIVVVVVVVVVVALLTGCLFLFS